MSNHANLAGLNALVTGGTRGIGWAIGQRLLEAGATVTVTGRGPAGREPVGCAYESVDFTDGGETEAFIRHLRDFPFDVLVNNAGINSIAPFAEIPLKDFERIQLVNVIVPFQLCKAVLPHMRSKRWGRIVTISSIWGRISKAQRGSYSASKFAVDGMTAALAAEVARDGILANCVAPGFIDTELTRSVLGENELRALEAQVPIGRLGKPKEIAELVAWLVSPANTYISGQNILIDGGFTRI